MKAEVARRTSDGATFVVLQRLEAIAPDEPVRLAVRDAPFGQAMFYLKRGTRQGVIDMGDWTTDVSPLDGDYAFVDLDPLRDEGVYTLRAEAWPYIGSVQKDYVTFKVSSEALEAATAPPEAPGEGTMIGRIAEAGVTGVEGVAKLPGAIAELPEALPKVQGVMLAGAAILGLVVLGMIMRKR